MYHLFKEPGRLGVIERVSEMISEKESYEEIGTGSIYNETTIADQIHTNGRAKPSILQEKQILPIVDQASGEGRRIRGNSCTGRISVGRKRKTWQILGGTRGYVGYDEHSSQTEIEPQYAPTLPL